MFCFGLEVECVWREGGYTRSFKWVVDICNGAGRSDTAHEPFHLDLVFT